MALLKKVKASTLMETMVATVLIVIIFMIASLVMNALLSAKIKGDTQAITEELELLQYQYISNKLTVPYFEDRKDWEITVQLDDVDTVSFSAIHQQSKKEVNSTLVVKNE